MLAHVQKGHSMSAAVSLASTSSHVARRPSCEEGSLTKVALFMPLHVHSPGPLASSCCLPPRPAPAATLQGDATAISGLSGTLYLGKLPSKPADGYVGVLPARPPPTPKGTAVVGLQLGTQQPLFSLVVAGENVYAASGSNALLQVLLLFLHLSHLELDGSLGGRHIQHLQLGKVLKAHKPRFDVISSASKLISRYL